MSAYNQNCVYMFGQKKADAKENVLTNERLEEIRKAAAKYLDRKTDEVEKRTAK